MFKVSLKVSNEVSEIQSSQYYDQICFLCMTELQLVGRLWCVLGALGVVLLLIKLTDQWG